MFRVGEGMFFRYVQGKVLWLLGDRCTPRREVKKFERIELLWIFTFQTEGRCRRQIFGLKKTYVCNIFFVKDTGAN